MPEWSDETLDMFDPEGAQRAKDEAIDRVEQNADQRWLHNARIAILNLARSGGTFTTDDLWATLRQPHEPRAMGAAIRAAVRDGIIHPTGDYRPSRRVACHGRPLRVWRGT